MTAGERCKKLPPSNRLPASTTVRACCRAGPTARTRPQWDSSVQCRRQHNQQPGHHARASHLAEVAAVLEHDDHRDPHKGREDAAHLAKRQSLVQEADGETNNLQQQEQPPPSRKSAAAPALAPIGGNRTGAVWLKHTMKKGLLNATAAYNSTNMATSSSQPTDRHLKRCKGAASGPAGLEKLRLAAPTTR
ncbi:hypothetical protein ON010_g5746 [Phytophthora cinnamomi]|nr:hypothetical protein ON010_g5746 [Phytophthora cinnamomi]